VHAPPVGLQVEVHVRHLALLLQADPDHLRAAQRLELRQAAGDVRKDGDGANTSLTHNFNFTTPRGVHGLRFGGDFRVYRAFENRYPLGTAPDFSFSTTYTRGPLDSSSAAPIGQDLASMLLGIATGSMERPGCFAMRNLYFGALLQDDIKLTCRLTLNLGLRYEFETPLTERFRVRGGILFAGETLSGRGRRFFRAMPPPNRTRDDAIELQSSLRITAAQGLPAPSSSR